MSQQRQLREYELVRLMLANREQFYLEFDRVAGDNGEAELHAITDRDKVHAILRIEFPAWEDVSPRRR